MTTIPGSWRPSGLALLGNAVDYAPAPLGEASTTLSAATTDSTTTAAMTSSSPADGGEFSVASSTGFPSPPATTLSADLDIEDGVMSVASVTGLEASGEVLVGGTERVAYGAISGTDLIRLTRGIGGTTVANHLSGAAVHGTARVLVDREVIYYHELSGAALREIARPRPVAHASGAVCATNADVVLTSASGFPAEGRVRLGGHGGEIITYTSISTNTLQGVQRGADATTPTAHAALDAADAVAFAVKPGDTRVYLHNTHAGDLVAGSFVRRSGLAAAGIIPGAEGEGIVGVAAAKILEDAWGPVLVGGVVAALMDASYSTAPKDCEPVFAASATTVKGPADASSGDEAIGWCLRTHDRDYDGTALTNARVDFVMLSQLMQSYTEP